MVKVDPGLCLGITRITPLGNLEIYLCMQKVGKNRSSRGGAVSNAAFNCMTASVINKPIS
jgi:hypothetical protein